MEFRLGRWTWNGEHEFGGKIAEHCWRSRGIIWSELDGRIIPVFSDLHIGRVPLERCQMANSLRTAQLRRCSLRWQGILYYCTLVPILNRRTSRVMIWNFLSIKILGSRCSSEFADYLSLLGDARQTIIQIRQLPSALSFYLKESLEAHWKLIVYYAMN